MIAPNSKVSRRKEHERWRWYAKAILLSDLMPKDWVIRKRAASRFWWFTRFERCNDEDVVVRRKTEISQKAVLGNVLAHARIATARIVRRQSDIVQLGLIATNKVVCVCRREAHVWADVPFGDCRAEDFVLCRIKCQSAWETDGFSQCEYSDFVACVDFRTIFRRLVIGLISFTGIVIIGALTWLLVGRTPNTTGQPEPLKVRTTSTMTNKTRDTLKKSPKGNLHGVPVQTMNRARVLSSTTSTNSNGVVIEKLILADGTKMSKIHPPPPIFSNPSDQVIALAISTPPGQAMPPLPDLQGIDKDFMRSLLSPIKINDDDTDEIKDLKKRVKAVKEELVEEIKNGGSVQDVLLAHQKEMNRLSESRLMAIQEMQRIAGENGVEAAQEFANRVNERFSEQGIPKIPVIGTHEER